MFFAEEVEEADQMCIRRVQGIWDVDTLPNSV